MSVSSPNISTAPSRSVGHGRHLCPECGSTFTRLQNLQRHRRSHAGLKPHKCSECGEHFARTDLVRRHQQQYHDGFVPAATPKACKSCSTSKIRCDRQTPCSQCRNKGILCESQVSSAFHAPADVRQNSTIELGGQNSSPHSMISTIASASTSTNISPRIATERHLESISDSTSMEWIQGLDDLLNTFSAPVTYYGFPHTLSPPPPGLGHIPQYLDPPKDPRLVIDTGQSSSISSSSSSEGSVSSSKSPYSGGLCPTLEMLSTVSWPTPGAISPEPPFVAPAPLNNGLPSVATLRNEPSSFFTPSMLELFPKLYMRHFNPHWPMFDPSTFQLTDVNAASAVAICCVGALYDTNPNSAPLATAVTLVQRPSLLTKLATHDLLYEDRLLTVQALLLYQFFGSFHREEHHRLLSAMFHGSLIQLLRQCHLLDRDEFISSVPLDPVQLRKRETRRRVVYGVFLLDMLQPVLNGSRALLSLDELALQAPSDSALPQLSAFSLYRQLLDPHKKVTVTDRFSALILVLALLGQVFDFLRLRHSTLASCSEITDFAARANDDWERSTYNASQTLEAVSESFKIRQQFLETSLSRWKSLWDTFDETDVLKGSFVYQNAMPIHMIVFSALSYSENSMEWAPSAPAVQPTSPSNHDPHGASPDFAQFCFSFRSFINPADWCGITWMFPPQQ